MKVEKNRIRIKDIANLAGVSEGTVDRVLHNRGEVSEKSRLAVETVLDEINYSPNLLARSLASKKHFNFAYLTPDHQANDYWDAVEKGFVEAANDFLQYNIHLEKYAFNQYDVQSFITIASTLINKNPDAVIIAPIFKEETLQLTKQLSEHEIPFSFIDSMINEVDFLTYYGQDSFQSGYIAAKLLFQSMPDNVKVLVVRTNRKGAVSNQTISRKKGFEHYVQQANLLKVQFIDTELTDDDELVNFQILQNVFSKHVDIKVAIVFNSKVSRLANHLEKLNRSDIRLIGYDLLDENIYYLKKGVVSYLLAQQPDKQAYLTVRDICNTLILKQEVKKINYVPIDILIKENIEDYLQFRN